MIWAYSERISCSTAHPPMTGGAGGAGSGEVPRYSEILVDSIATSISMRNGTLMSRVPRPPMRRRPPPISSTAIAGASTSGIGIPSLVNRPTPWFAYAKLQQALAEEDRARHQSQDDRGFGTGRRGVDETSMAF